MRQFDSRTVRRKIKSGRVSEADYKEFLTTLPDLSDKVKPRDDGGDDDGYEERIANRGRSHESVQAKPPPAPPPAVRVSDSDPFAAAPSMTTPVPSPSAPIAPSAPAVAPAASPLPTPSFDLPPLDPPTSPSSPRPGSSDDGE